MKRSLIAAATLSLATTLAGCGDGEPKADPTPSPPSSPVPTTATPSWQDKYTPAQLKRYDAARKRWEEYSRSYNEAARKGVDTPGVKAMFKEYSTTALVDHSQFLDQFVRGGARLEAPPKPLWYSAEEIGTSWVVIKQCTDYTNVRVTVNGQVAKQPKPYRRLITIRMSKAEGHDWMKMNADSGDLKPCGPTAE